MADLKEYFYNGITNLRCEKSEVEMTEEQLEIRKRIQTDIVFFAENFFYITDPNRGRVRIKLHQYQKEMLVMLMKNRRIVCNFSRQIGKTTIVTIFITWFILTHTDKNVGVASYAQNSSVDILDKIKSAYVDLPIWLQFSVLVWNTNHIRLVNNCRIYTAATNGNSFRGKTINVLYVDETAIIENDIWKKFEDSVLPAITADKLSQIIYTSTPLGYNHFYKIVQDAKFNLSDFVYMEVKWDQVPGRGPKWKQEQLDNMSDFNKEDIFKQNFECEFISEESTLIDSKILNKMQYQHPIEIVKGVKIYEKFKPDRKYVVGVDAASGRGKDLSAIIVLDITTFPFRQVAIYLNNSISIIEFSILVKWISLQYNAPTCIESNQVGQSVIEILMNEYQYSNIVYGDDGRPGFYTSIKSKRKMIETLKLLIENGRLLLVDMETIKQMGGFAQKSNGSYSAIRGFWDDAVMATAIACFYIHTPEYEGDSFTKLVLEDGGDKDYILMYIEGDTGVEEFSATKSKYNDDYNNNIISIGGGGYNDNIPW